MAKIKISELATELGKEGKELVSYFQENGVDAKRVTSSVEEADADKARKHFGGAKKETPVQEKKEAAPEKAAAPVEKKEDSKKETAPAKTEKAAAPEKKNEAKTSSEAPVKKKKKIIIVSNQNNSKFDRGQRPSGNGQNGSRDRDRNRGNQNNGKNSYSASQSAYHPIKPKTVPSQVESYDVTIPRYEEKPVKKAQPAPVSEVAETKAPVQEKTPVAETPKQETVAAQSTTRPAQTNEQRNAGNDREQRQNNGSFRGNNDNRNGGYNRDRNQNGGFNRERNGQGGNFNKDRNGQNNGGFNRDRNQGQGGFNRSGQGNGQGGFNRGGQGGGFNRSGQGGQSQGGFAGRRGTAGPGARPGRGGQGFAAPVSGRDGDKRREEEKRRKSQEKEKRGAKNFTNYDEDESQMTRAKRVGRFIKPEVKKEEVQEEQIKVISVPENISIKDLAAKMHLQPAAIVKKLFLAGQMVTANSEISYEEAENIAIEYDIICEKEIPVDVIEELLKEEDDAEETLEKRPPVVCVMGHVDHGKTSLLDAIRDTSVTEREAGGITQRIGAYMVTVNGEKITFLDTPGHEAFTAMRMRGANSTDIAVLVVAADDGVMPQTVEAINHAKAAGIEIIVAVNKIDKPNANVDRVKQELTEHGLIATDWGGTTEFVPVSAKTGEGIDTLLETILLTADILELKANPNRNARGLVLEAKLDKGRGPVANVLVQKGTLHVGDFISAGACSGKVRAMADDKGRRVKEATPSQPVEILGLSDVPSAGEVILSHESDKEAKSYANTYKQQHKKELIDETRAKMSLDDLYSKIEEGKLQELDIIIKADVQGSAEALKQSLIKLSNDEVVVKVIHSGVGAINESDVSLASASSAIIIGFDVRPDATAKSMAEHEGVEIKLYKVIYQAIDEVEAAMKGMLAPVYEEKIIGHAEVRQIFKASAIGNIAGSYITSGMLQRDCNVRITRGEEQIYEGKLKSLKRFKDDVKEVKEGYECGLVFDGFDQINVGDTIEGYIMVEVPRE